MTWFFALTSYNATFTFFVLSSLCHKTMRYLQPMDVEGPDNARTREQLV